MTVTAGVKFRRNEITGTDGRLVLRDLGTIHSTLFINMYYDVPSLIKTYMHVSGKLGKPT